MRIYLLAAASLGLVAAPAAAQIAGSAEKSAPLGLTFTTGADYSSGDYGLGSKTDILVVPFSLRAKTGNFSFSASLPYLHIRGAGALVGADGTPIPGVPVTGSSRSGLGDVTLGATYRIPGEQLGGVELAIGGRVKLPTASKSKQLTTGKTDESVSLDLSYPTGVVTPFVNVGYRFLGDPVGVKLRDGPTASVGSSVQLGKATLIGSYDYARSVTSLTRDSHQRFGGLSGPASNRFTLTGYGTKGLSSGAADYGAGLLLSVKVL